MGMSNIYGELSEAADRLKEGREAAYQAKGVMDSSAGILQKQGGLRTTAQEQARRAQAAITEAQEQLRILAATLQEGNEGGWKLHEHVTPAADFLQTAGEKMDAATSHLRTASPSGEFRGADILSHVAANYGKLNDARRAVQAVDDAGQRFVTDFSVTKRSTEQLSSIVGLADDQVASLLGQIATIGEKKVTNTGAVEPQDGAVAAENFAGALHYTATIVANLANPDF
jgi:hypothetical protein